MAQTNRYGNGGIPTQGIESWHTADLLGIPKRDPLLRIRQVIYSTKGRAIMYVLGFYRSDRHNLVIRRFR